MSAYIPADKLIKSVSNYQEEAKAALNPTDGDADYYKGKIDACKDMQEFIPSLQQEQPEIDMKSPFTGGKVVILSRGKEVTFRGEKVKILRKYYRCEDTGREFTDSKLDDDMMWTVFRAYCEKKGMSSFTDIMLKQEQPDLPSGEEVMTMCNQILIDWVKEGKTQEEKEQREQAHIRFFELYDEYIMQEQPEVDLEKEVKNEWEKCNPTDEGMGLESATIVNEQFDAIARYFYELGLNAKKEEL